MGMSASQARLLTLTARIHDVEYQSQAIQNAKLALATQEDQVYKEYLNALDATTLTVLAIDPQSAVKSTMPGTFNNLFSMNRVRPANSSFYLLRDSRGRAVVEDEIYEAYSRFSVGYAGDNANAFAMYMMDRGGRNPNPPEDGLTNWDFEIQCKNAEYDIFINHLDNTNLVKLRNDILGLLYGDDASGYESLDEDDVTRGTELYDDGILESLSEEDRATYEDLLTRYLNELYSNYSEEIYKNMNGDSNIDFDLSEYQYYVRMYNAIKACGGCISINDFNGPNGNSAANDSDWLQSMIQSGLMTISTIEGTEEITIKGTGVSSDSCLNYTEVSQIDKTKLAKAEAEYEHKLKAIDKKDKQFDMSLSKLETERNALTTEYDQVKKVIQDNVDRTFKIFS